MNIRIDGIELEASPLAAQAFAKLEKRREASDKRADSAERKAAAYSRVVDHLKGELAETKKRIAQLEDALKAAGQAFDMLGATPEAIRAERARRAKPPT